MLTLDDLPSLALFARVVDLRSFTAAAREARIAKSAVSRRVADLEDTLGVRLLRRSTRKLSVTEEGLRVYQEAAKLVAAAAAAEEAAGHPSGSPRGKLRIGAPITFGQAHLARAVARFVTEFPEVQVELSTDNRLVDLVESGLDVVVRMGRLADASYYARKIAADRLIVCASPEYLERRGTPVEPADLLEHHCLHYSLVPLAAEWRFRDHGQKTALPVRSSFAADDAGVIRAAALEGLGLAVVPSFVVKRDVEAGRLRLVLDGTRRAAIGIFAVTSHRTNAPTRVRAFLDFLARHFARWERAETLSRPREPQPAP